MKNTVQIFDKRAYGSEAALRVWPYRYYRHLDQGQPRRIFQTLLCMPIGTDWVKLYSKLDGFDLPIPPPRLRSKAHILHQQTLYLVLKD